MKPERLAFIDGLRGVAAVMVMSFHLGSRTSLEPAVSLGYLGVAVFFVLSGFVIAKTLGRNAITPSFATRFAARRSLRLDPPYWITLGLTVAYAHVQIAILGAERVAPSLRDIALHTVYLQDFAGVAPISAVFWTLCMEIQFYLFALLLLGTAAQKVESAAFQVLWLGLMGLSLLQYGEIVPVISVQGLFFPYWYLFALGALTLWTVEGRTPKPALFAAIAGVLAMTAFKHGTWALTGGLTAAAIYLAHQRQRMGSWLSDPVSQFLGRTSYSLYLLHGLVGWAAQSTGLLFVDQWTALAIGIAGSLVSAWIFYRLIERPSIRLSRRISTEPGAMRYRPVRHYRSEAQG